MLIITKLSCSIIHLRCTNSISTTRSHVSFMQYQYAALNMDALLSYRFPVAKTLTGVSWLFSVQKVFGSTDSSRILNKVNCN